MADIAGSDDPVGLATVELLGALAYGQLRSVEAAARLIALAPDVRTADQVAEVVVHELEAYRRLRDHLAERTELPTAVMDRQKAHFDAYFDRAPLDDWFGASVFFALGLPMASDFANAIAPVLEDATAQVVTEAIAGRPRFEQGAIEQLATQLVDDAAIERARHLSADLLGRALTSYQGAVGDTDALSVLLAAGEDERSAERRVKELAIEVLGKHRRRMVELGLEDLDDVR
ncbi:MAG: ferritin-like fold-containing protein [Nitriliruptoraceae bacterium]